MVTVMVKWRTYYCFDGWYYCTVYNATDSYLVMVKWRTYYCFDCEEPLELDASIPKFLFVLCEACREKWRGTEAMQQGFVGSVDDA